MKLDYRYLAFVLVVASGLTGCKGMWNDFFGGNSTQKALGLAPGELETCVPERDPNIASKLANNVPCSADSQCPVGSFCTGNGVSGTCIRECGDGLPNCTGNRYCSCLGVCENITQEGVDGGGGTSPGICDRLASRLAELKGTDESKWQDCTSDDICPNGSYCYIGRCWWDCNDETPCPSGEQCDCYGRCVNPDAGTTLMRRRFDLAVTPATVQVTPELETVGTWMRTITVVLRTRDPSILSGTGDIRTFTTAITVRPGRNLKIACMENSPAAAADCNLGADGPWQFSLAGDTWVAARTVWLQPSNASATDAGIVGDPWSIQVFSEVASPQVTTIPIAVSSAKAGSSWTNPVFDFSGNNDHPKGYRGMLLVSTPLGFAGDSTSGVDHQIQVPVQATVHKWVDVSPDRVFISFRDLTHMLVDNSLFTVDAGDGTVYGGVAQPWLTFTPGSAPLLEGQITSELVNTELRRNERTGTLSGKFYIRTYHLDGPGAIKTQMRVSYIRKPFIYGGGSPNARPNTHPTPQTFRMPQAERWFADTAMAGNRASSAGGVGVACLSRRGMTACSLQPTRAA